MFMSVLEPIQPHDQLVRGILSGTIRMCREVDSSPPSSEENARKNTPLSYTHSCRGTQFDKGENVTFLQRLPIIQTVSAKAR
jgi:hypothetical protein